MLVEDSFEATGLTFLTTDALRASRRAVASAPTPERWRYEWGARLEDTRLKRTIPGRDVLQVWEPSEPAQGYVVVG